MSFRFYAEPKLGSGRPLGNATAAGLAPMHSERSPIRSRHGSRLDPRPAYPQIPGKAHLVLAVPYFWRPLLPIEGTCAPNSNSSPSWL
jgi:hypothetical protein